MNIISIKNLCKNYKEKKALENISLDVDRGELFGLLGVNGAGKTTLIKILCGLTKKTSGEVVVNGFNLEKDINKIKQIVDISPQETSVANNLTVRENLEFFAQIYSKDNEQSISEIVKIFKLDDVLNQRRIK